MLIKRTASRREWSEMDELINYLLIDDDLIGNSLVSRHMDNPHLRQYFNNLHEIISSKNLHQYKGYQTLSDGIYILLKGEIKFAFDDRGGEKQKMKRSKTINLRGQSTATINQPWQVFQSTLKNCTTTMESFLLKVNEEQAQMTDFHLLFQKRRELYDKQYLSLDHQRLLELEETRKAFSVEMKIHSNFTFKKYFFRQIISLTTPAIVSEGRAKLKLNRVYTREFDQCGVLLPNLQYQVTSSEIEIMVINDNQTLFYMIHSKQEEEMTELQHIKSCKTTFNSLHKTRESIYGHYQNSINSRQNDKKGREMTRVFKQVEPYSIISSHLCQQSLKFAKKHNIIHNTRKKKENRYVHPLILFDIVSQKSKLATPNFHNLHRSGSNDSKSKPVSTHKVCSQSENQSAILRKIKLSRSDYDTIMGKYKQVSTEAIKRKTFKMGTDKIQTNCDDQQFS